MKDLQSKQSPARLQDWPDLGNVCRWDWSGRLCQFRSGMQTLLHYKKRTIKLYSKAGMQPSGQGTEEPTAQPYLLPPLHLLSRIHSFRDLNSAYKKCSSLIFPVIHLTPRNTKQHANRQTTAPIWLYIILFCVLNIVTVLVLHQWVFFYLETECIIK